MDLTKVCRTCLIDNGEMQSIFSDPYYTNNGASPSPPPPPQDSSDIKSELITNKNNKNLISLPKMIKICTRTTVSHLDGLPDQMCRPCIENIIGFYEFKQKCEFSYEKLLKNITGHKICLNVDDKSIQTDELLTLIPCEMCDEKFTTEEGLKQHRLVHKEDGFQCRLCQNSYSRLSHLKRHQQANHPEILTKKVLIKIEKNVCNICDKQFVRNDHLKRHMKSVHGNKCENEMLQTNDDQKDHINLITTQNTDDISDNKENLKEIIDFEDNNCDNNYDNGDNGGDEFDDDGDAAELELDEEKFEVKPIELNELTKELVEDISIVKKSRGRPKKVVNNISDNVTDVVVENSTNVSKIPSTKSPKLKKKHINGSGKQHVCEICNRCFARSTHLKRHLTIHSDFKPFECDLCEKKFRRLDHLKNHQMHHNSVKGFTCDICNRGFHRADNIRKHMETKHSNKPRIQSQKTDFCKICNRGFSTPKYLKSHMRIHNEENIFACKMCEETYSTKAELTEHLKIHVNARPFLCSECGLSFVRNDYLVVHMRRHKGEKPYKCKYCSKGFPRATDLTVHERYHTGEKTHLCTTCGKGFQRAYNLVVHMRVHTGERPYQCPHCTKSFAQGNDLKAHIRRHTGERYKCELCGDGFIQGYHLTQHKRNVHGIDVKSSIRRVEKFVIPTTVENKQQIQEQLDQPQQEQQVQHQYQEYEVILPSISIDDVKIEPTSIINYSNECSQSSCGQQSSTLQRDDVPSNHGTSGAGYNG